MNALFAHDYSSVNGKSLSMPFPPTTLWARNSVISLSYIKWINMNYGL